VRLTTNTLTEGSKVAWSPDGSRIAFDATAPTGDTDIYVIDATGGIPTRLTRAPGLDRYPTWTPDGRRIAFTSDRDGDDEIYVMNADGTGIARLTTSTSLDIVDSWRR
jgi:TolB protein